MSKDQTPKPPGDHLVQQFEAMRPLAKLVGFFNSGVRKQFKEVEQQLNNVKQMVANLELFAQTYSVLGWVNYDRLSTDVVASVVGMPIEDGEAILTKYHLDADNLSFLGYRFKTKHYDPWFEMFERAVERATAEDFLSAIPLVLSVIDGICTTSTGKHPFSGGADAPVFDSQTSGPGGLSEGLALLGSTRRKLHADAISLPFRHGIVHGLNPNYGHPVVAAKAFNLLQATVDYFDRRRDEAERIAKAAEEQKPIDLRELGENLRKNAETKRALQQWRARPVVSGVPLASSDTPANLPVGTPEAFVAHYLSLLTDQNYGELAKATVDYPKRPIGYRAGKLRENLKSVRLTGWTITGIEDTAPAMSRVTAMLEGRLDNKMWRGERAMRVMFADEDHEVLVRNQLGGTWVMLPDFPAGLWLFAFQTARASGSSSV